MPLAACTADKSKPLTPTIPSPPEWSSLGANTVAAAPGDLSQWWTRLGDPALSALIEQALHNNTDVRTAQARLREARAQRNLAAANRYPSVTASGSATGQSISGSDSGVVGGVVAGNSSSVYSAGFDASWEPDVFGGKRRALAAAEADLRATVDDLHQTEVSLVAEVALYYVELRAYQTRLSIARQNAASQVETFQITQWRAAAGLVSSVDVEQARTNFNQTQAQIPTLETNVAQTRHRLAILLGLAPGALKERLAEAAPIPKLPDEIAVGIPADTLRQRPDVRAAEQRILAETARLAKQQTARYPSFSLTGSIGLELITGALTGSTSFLRSGSASLTQTIFDAGRIRAQINAQSAVQERAVVTYEATVLTALEDVENALVSFARTRERIASLRTAAEGARNAALLARNRYSAGITDFQTVLDTERTVLTIEDSLATTEGDRATALVQLYKALGGGWSSAPAAASESTQGKRS